MVSFHNQIAGSGSYCLLSLFAWIRLEYLQLFVSKRKSNAKAGAQPRLTSATIQPKMSTTHVAMLLNTRCLQNSFIEALSCEDAASIAAAARWKPLKAYMESPEMTLPKPFEYYFRYALPDPGCELFYQWNSPDTFHSFNKLPVELRLIIWHLVNGTGRKVVARVQGIWYRALQSRTPTPVTFRINHESRQETLRLYTKPYHHLEYPTKGHPQRALHRNYFDPEIDTLCMTDRRGLCLYYEGLRSRNIKGDDFSRIRHLEIGRCNWSAAEEIGWRAIYESMNSSALVAARQTNANIAPRYPESEFAFIRLFTGLETLTIVCGGNGLRGLSQVRDCITSLTDLFQEMKDNEISKIPIIRARIPCHIWEGVECTIYG